MSIFSKTRPTPIAPSAPDEGEVRAAFEGAQKADPWAYAHMDLDTFFWGYLVGKGWTPFDAAEFVTSNPVKED